MDQAACVRRGFIARFGFAGLCLLLLAIGPRILAAQDCLTCHGDASMTDSAGHSIAVDGQKFGDSIHGSLQCSNCHADIKGYPHPDKIAPVDCKTCHADQANDLKSSVHADSKDHPCTSCHGNAHEIFPKTDARSAGVSAECAEDLRPVPRQQRHGRQAWIGQRLPELHRLDSRLRAEQRGTAGGGQLPKLSRLA